MKVAADSALDLSSDWAASYMNFAVKYAGCNGCRHFQIILLIFFLIIIAKYIHFRFSKLNVAGRTP